MGISTLGDLAGASLRDFQRVSNRGRELFLEVVRLLQQARQADLGARVLLRSVRIFAGSPQQARQADPGVRAGQGETDHSTASGRPRDETIFIPLEARGKPLATLSLSVRLRHVLEGRAGVRLVGDLHGRTLSQFRDYANFGNKTLGELRDVVRAIQHEHHGAPTSRADAAAEERPSPVSAGAFFVPANLHNLKVSELPVSVRLEGVLQRKRVLRLGDLHGVPVKDLNAIDNCGSKTVREAIRLIERAASGEFETGPDIPWNPAEVVRVLDTLIAGLPERSQRMLVARLGGKENGVPTLEEVGVQFGLTRERVRQVFQLSIDRICKAGSRQLRAHLDHIERFCREKVCPLTPALLRHWLEQPPSGGRFSFVFYFRLIGELRPAIPAWPAGQDFSPGRQVGHEKIERELQSLLGETFQSMPLSEALPRLRLKAPGHNLQATELLAMLQHSRRLTIEFPRPDAPVVRLTRRSAPEVAKAVLQASDLPLTPEEIQTRARASFGYESALWSSGALANALAQEQGFYLLGPRSYGLRRHIQLPGRTWARVRADFRALLSQENRPISTAEITSRRSFDWADQTNTHELACILREDDHLIDLGRFLFALAEWGIEERQYVRDLVPRVLQAAHRPLTGAEILAGLQQLRSVSPTSIANSLRKHPEVRDYGAGHYGLKSWGDSVKSSIVTDARLVESVIHRAAPPLTFLRLCEILDVASAGELADKLWQTCSAMPDVIRVPEERSDTSRLVHRSCRLERALVATAGEVNRPLPLYELQWEVNARFGPLFATKPLDEYRRTLEQSTMFLRNAAGEFILDIHLDQLGLDAHAVRRACADLLSETNEIVGCEALLERLEADGKSREDLSPDILASVLRDDAAFQEVGRHRFRLKPCKR